jgi:hypothetical protein
LIDLKKSNSNGADRKSVSSKSQLRFVVSKYLRVKLEAILSRSYIPWSEMKEEDVINWPPSVKMKPLTQMKTNELRRLNKLAKQDLLNFSPEFLSRLKITVTKIH